MGDGFDDVLGDDHWQEAASTPAPRHEILLAGLNAGQCDSVSRLSGANLILAGAGTGKTRVLTTRLGILLDAQEVQPWQILCVTFTNKAARNMADRIAAMGVQGAKDVWLGTFHGIAARILRRHAQVVGLQSDFTIINSDDQKRLLLRIVRDNQWDEKHHPPAVILNLIQRQKDRGVLPDHVSVEDNVTIGKIPLQEFYHLYQQQLVQLQAVDFGDLLLHNLTIFRLDPGVGQQYQRQFHYILVDEYQDTNVAQYLWLRFLALGHGNICCVGDDDQSIYGWRGAEVGNILKFESDFADAKLYRLEQNYRSSPDILGAANGLIRNNKSRLGKDLFSQRNDSNKVQVVSLSDDRAEARRVVGDIEGQLRGAQNMEYALSETAVLVRTGAQTRGFEEQFIARHIPYRIVGGMRFYEREEIRDALAYLRLISQPADDLAFLRIINKPARGIGATSLGKLQDLARIHQVPLAKITEKSYEFNELSGPVRKKLAAFQNQLDHWRDFAGRQNLVTLVQHVLEESGYASMWRNSKKLEAEGKVENLQELLKAVEPFTSLSGFLEHVSLIMDVDAESHVAGVGIMTLHAAKGLEFEQVYLPGWEEGLFPNQRAIDEKGEAGIEEERRLAYVGLTRAKNRVVILHCASRMLHGRWMSSIASRFIDELPGEFVTGKPQKVSLQDRLDRCFDNGLRQNKSYDMSANTAPRAQRTARRLPNLSLGDLCTHAKFGEGTILAIDGDILTIR
ncbi:MAG: UvrD-helicase domain-containing protein, partial [Pseudomonadota bacterium]